LAVRSQDEPAANEFYYGRPGRCSLACDADFAERIGGVDGARSGEMSRARLERPARLADRDCQRRLLRRPTSPGLQDAGSLFCPRRSRLDGPGIRGDPSPRTPTVARACVLLLPVLLPIGALYRIASVVLLVAVSFALFARELRATRRLIDPLATGSSPPSEVASVSRALCSRSAMNSLLTQPHEHVDFESGTGRSTQSGVYRPGAAQSPIAAQAAKLHQAWTRALCADYR